MRLSFIKFAAPCLCIALLAACSGGKVISSFEDCAAAGYPIMESYPPQCRTPEGKTFVQEIGNEVEKYDLIRISHPRPQEEVGGSFVVEGEARGTWFFEASFPIVLTDAEGNVLASTHAQAQDEWMTEEFVPFKAMVEANIQGIERGVLLLKKDNPSGEAENDDELRVPVRFTSGE